MNGKQALVAALRFVVALSVVVGMFIAAGRVRVYDRAAFEAFSNRAAAGLGNAVGIVFVLMAVMFVAGGALGVVEYLREQNGKP